jgi:uncharacterized protein YukE
MAACSRDLADLAADVEEAHHTLHGVWAGLASEAHSALHHQWGASFAEMSSALIELRLLAKGARTNYTSAVEANLALWEQVR